MRVSKTEFLKMVQESVSKEILGMLNENWLDKADAMRRNIGAGITGRDKIDSAAYSKAKDQQRTNKRSNDKLRKIQGAVNARFQSKIAPLLSKYGVDSNSVLQAINSAIQQNMKNDSKVDINSYRKVTPLAGGQNNKGNNQGNNTGGNNAVNNTGGNNAGNNTVNNTGGKNNTRSISRQPLTLNKRTNITQKPLQGEQKLYRTIKNILNS